MKDSVSTEAGARAATPPPQPREGGKRRKVTPPRRRVSARVVDRRDPRPIIFNYGANLTRHEREQAKERVAMVAVAAVAALCAVILIWGWADQTIIQPAQPVATVNGTDIHKSEYAHMQQWQTLQLNAQMSQMRQEMAKIGATKATAGLAQYLQQQYQQLQAQQQSIPVNTLTSMEETIVMRQKGMSQFGIQASAADLTTQTNTIQKQLGGITSYAQILRSTGLSTSEFRRWIVEPALLRTKITSRLGAKISPQGPESVHARHILVKTEPVAKQIMAQLLAGGSWSTLAKKYSIDPGSKNKGGDLGTFTQGAMVPPFDKAVFSMKPGEIRLVKSSFGWHVVQDLSKPSATKLSAQELQTKKDSAFTQWIQGQFSGVHITPASAIPNFGYTGLGATGSSSPAGTAGK